MRLRNSLSRKDWKIEDAMATPPTWPMPRKSCPKPVPTAMTESKAERLNNHIEEKLDFTYGGYVRAKRLSIIRSSNIIENKVSLTQGGLRGWVKPALSTSSITQHQISPEARQRSQSREEPSIGA